MNNIRYTIHRYEIYGNPPSGKMVGFLINNIDNNRYEYVETLITNEECENKNDSAICTFAFNKMKSQIDSLSESLLSPSIVGSEYVP
jgi:hypothetical protein